MNATVTLDELMQFVDVVAKCNPGTATDRKWGAWLDHGGLRIAGFGPTPRAACQDALRVKHEQMHPEVRLW